MINHEIKGSMMKTHFLLIVSLVLSACIIGCNSGNDSSDFSVDGLTPLVGSDSIIGTWVGVTDYVETADNITYTSTYTGSRAVIVQITDDGTGGYSLTDCDGGNQSVTFSSETNQASVLDRDLTVTNFNTMTGTSTIAEWGEVGEENWSWVKVNNRTNNIGSMVFSGPAGTSELLSLCRESHAYSDTDGDQWTTLMDKGVHTSSTQSVPESFYIRVDSDGFALSNFEVEDLSVNNLSGSVSFGVVSASPAGYDANYSVSQGVQSLSARIRVDVSQ